MAQIRRDMTTGKRLVSLETVPDRTFEDGDQSERSIPVQVSVIPASPRNGQNSQSQNSRTHSPTPAIPASSNHPPPADNDKQKIALPRKIPKPSPRKLLRRLSAADEVDRELAMTKSNSDVSFPDLPASKTRNAPLLQQSLEANSFNDTPRSPRPSPELLSPSHTPHRSQSVQVLHMSATAVSPLTTNLLLPQAPQIDTEPVRVVSGGTTSSLETADSVLTRGTTATSSTSVITGRTASAQSVASAPSFVKHAGPVQMTRIGPEDVPSLPELVGGMRFDRQLMRWVKTGQPKEAVQGKEDGGSAGPSEDSEDPFRSFESLVSGRVEELASVAHAQPSVEQVDEEHGFIDANEEHETRVDKLAAAVATMVLPDDDTEDSFDFDDDSVAAVVEVMTGVGSHDTDVDTETTDSGVDEHHSEEGSMVEIPSEKDEDEAAAIPARDPVATISLNLVPLPESYSTPSLAHRTGLAPPRSVLKNGNSSSTIKTPGSALRTPVNLFSSAHRRSVSFSDGRKDGKIRGLGREVGDEQHVPEPDCVFPFVTSAGTTPGMPSARGDRIAAILEDLNETEPSFEDTPSKASTSFRPPTGAIQAFALRQQSNSTSRRPFTRSAKVQDLSLAQGNQTLLTECSFGVTHDKLVHVITDVHPYVPHWESLGHINLSKKGIESVARLKEFLPNLDALNL